MRKKKRKSNPGMWIGFGFVAGVVVGWILEPRAMLMFAALGIIVSVLVVSSMKR